MASISNFFGFGDEQEMARRDAQGGRERKKSESVKKSGSRGWDETTLFFYERDKPFYEFTNFSPHTVTYRGKVYPTSEHLFQARKFLDKRPELAEQIRTAQGSRQALETATRLRKLQRSDWFDVNIGIMEEVVYLKFTQHSHLRSMLLGTGERELVEASPVDAFWGYGADRKGRNELGKALMKIRVRLRGGQTPSVGSSVATVGSVTASRPPPPVPPKPVRPLPRPQGMSEVSQTSLVSRPCNPRTSSSTTSTTPGGEARSESLAQPLFFYRLESRFHGFSNKSYHEVWYQEKPYPTAEHLFQALQFLDTVDASMAEHIRTQRDWTAAVKAASNLAPRRRPDWVDVRASLMDVVIEQKFTQHRILLDMLLATQGRQLVYDDPYDDFWGIGQDKKGKNELGQTLMRMREMFSARRLAASISPGNVDQPKPSTTVAAASPTPSQTVTPK